MRRLMCVILLLCSVLTSAVFGASQKEQATAAGAGAPVTLKMYTTENASWPFKKDWYILDVIRRKTNITFDVSVASGSDFGTKLNLIMASGDLPDVLYMGNAAAMQYGLQGALVNALEYEKDMPNFAKWRKANMQRLAAVVSADGRMFVFPAIEIGETERQGWF